jgi:hypothetical protein
MVRTVIGSSGDPRGHGFGATVKADMIGRILCGMYYDNTGGI